MSEPQPHLLNEPDLTGQQIGDYVLIRRLGRGGMADVYLAEQKSLQRKVAFKVLHQSLANDPAYVERFKHEAQAAAALTHPNIVRIYEVGTVGNCHYISQEYVEGQNLKQYLTDHSTVSAFMAVTTIRQVAAALHKAREQGVIHRDIKPENIMVKDGEVKVADFGLARINRSDRKQGLTQVGMTMGTPLYMSPEQAEGATVDHRSDIYSLGVTAYHMLAGHPPFEKETAIATAVAHKTEQAVPLGQLRDDLPAELVSVVEKMMEKDPAARYQDCGAIIKDLLQVQLDDSQEVWSPNFKTLSPAETQALYSSHLDATRKLNEAIHGSPARQRRKRFIWMAATVVVTTVMAFAFGSILASLNPPPPLLPPPKQTASTIPRKSNVFDQLNYARQIPNSEYQKKLDAFNAVKEYFPLEGENVYAKRSSHLWADFYTGLLQFHHKYYDQADTIFQDLAELDPDEYLIFRLHGLAGHVLVLDKRKTLDGADIEELDQQIESFRADIMPDIDRFEPELKRQLESIYQQLQPARGN